MGFVEYLRVRKSLTIFVMAMLAGAAFITFSAAYGIGHGQESAQGSGHTYSIAVGPGSQPADGGPGNGHLPRSFAELNFQIPIAWLFGVAGFFSILLATILGTSLSKENGRNGFAFTKPVSRERLALTFIAIDVAAVLVSFLATVAIIFAALAILGIAGKVYANPGAATIACAGLGSALMWYGLLQFATATRTTGAGLFIGLSWPVFFIALALHGVTEFGPIFHAAIVAVDFFNPLAYFELTGRNDDMTIHSLFGFSEATSIAITYSMAVLACTGAVFGWKRMEA